MCVIRELPIMSFPNAIVVGLRVANCAVSFASNSSGFDMSKTNPTVQITPGEMN